MTLIDFHACEPQFADHLAPIYLALPPEYRGDFIATRAARTQAHGWGIDAMPREDHPQRPTVVASYGDHKKVRRLGRRMIARVEHGAGQSYFGDLRFGGNSSYAGGRDCHDASLFLAPNRDSARRWKDAYPGATVEVVGCPKLDYLPAREPGPLTVALSFHFDINLIPETRWAWPAYRSVIPDLAARFPLIAHCHPKAAHAIDRHYRQLNIEIVPEFADVCRRADLYICDNSSTLVEFASTGRPVVVLNIPEYRRDVSHGGRFWDWADVGLQCDDPADLVAVVERALVEDHTERREAALDVAYAYRTGGAIRAAGALVQWATGSQAVAA